MRSSFSCVLKTFRKKGVAIGPGPTAIDADAPRRQVEGHGPRRRLEPSLAGVIGDHLALRAGRTIGADIDDAARFLLLGHQAGSSLGTEEHAFQIRRQHDVPEFFGDFQEMSDGRCPDGVVDQDLNAAEGLSRLLEEPIGVAGPGHIGAHGQHAMAAAADCTFGLLEP
jgi:hypothetical protein